MSELMELKEIYKTFKKGPIHSVVAVDNISLDIQAGTNIGIIGESGSGKTTLGKIMTKLIEPDSGKIVFDSRDVTRLKRKKIRDFRRNVQMIFQDPYSSLDSKMTVQKLLSDFIKLNGGEPDQETLFKSLDNVSLNNTLLGKYPSELSGGQRQRVAIARALTLKPRLIIADEPVSSLDVSVRAQILELLNDLHAKANLTFVYVTHDISSLPFVAKKVYVMYRGSVVEVSEIRSLLNEPLHPYSRGLLASVPDYGRDITDVREHILEGVDIDKMPPNGCKFYYRCAYAMDRCKDDVPKLRKMENGREVACHLIE